MEKITYNNHVYRVVLTSENAKKIDEKVKNKWNWAWLQEKDVNGDYLSDYMRKIDACGLAFCIYCNKTLSYGSTGKSDLFKHAKSSPKHLPNKVNYLKTTTLPQSWIEPNNKDLTCAPLKKPCTLPYGVAENVHETATCPSLKEQTSGKIYSLVDRTINLEAYILSFTAENSLPLSSVPKLIEFGKFLSRDRKALSRVKMERTAATYKLKDGLSIYVHKSVVEKMKLYPFSINIDECTSNNNHKVFSILVSFFDEEEGVCKVEHYESISLIVVNSLTLFDTICKLFLKDEIPFGNLVSDLSDSTNYMRGKKSGLEKRLRDKAPHLLDIDGDVCHHIHNTVKEFCKPFENFVEKFIDDLHWDTKYSTDILDALRQICLVLDINFKKPPQRISHRWLSIFDCLSTDITMYDAFKLLYYPWIPSNLINCYEEDISKFFSKYNVNAEGKHLINNIQQQMKRKSLTEDGKDRKERIVTKLFYENNYLNLVSNFFISVLPLFKSFVLIFEQKEPNIHKLHDMMTQTLRTFLSCFMIFESIPNSSNKLKCVDIASNIRKLKSLFVGDDNDQLISLMRKNKSQNEIVLDFYNKVRSSYLNSGVYLQKKYAIDNPVLKYLSAIDPVARGYSITHNYLINLKPFFQTFLNNVSGDYSAEVRNYIIDNQLPQPLENERLDSWWSKVFKTERYPVLSCLVRASLSIFTGPMVESSFSMMNDIIDSRSGRMDIDTYSAIMTTKYNLKTSGKTASQKFTRKDILRDPIDTKMLYFIRTANSRYKKRLCKNAEELQNKKEKLRLSNIISIKEKKKLTVHERAKNLCASIKKKNSSKASTKLISASVSSSSTTTTSSAKLTPSSTTTTNKTCKNIPTKTSSSTTTLVSVTTPESNNDKISFQITDSQPAELVIVGSKRKTFTEKNSPPKKKQMKLSSFFTSK